MHSLHSVPRYRWSSFYISQIRFYKTRLAVCLVSLQLFSLAGVQLLDSVLYLAREQAFPAAHLGQLLVLALRLVCKAMGWGRPKEFIGEVQEYAILSYKAHTFFYLGIMNLIQDLHLL